MILWQTLNAHITHVPDFPAPLSWAGPCDRSGQKTAHRSDMCHFQAEGMKNLYLLLQLLSFLRFYITLAYPDWHRLLIWNFISWQTIHQGKNRHFSEMQNSSENFRIMHILSRSYWSLREEKDTHGRQNKALPLRHQKKDVLDLISRICEYVTLCGKRNFEVGRLSWITLQTQHNHQGPYKWRKERGESESEIWRCCNAGFEVRKRAHEPKNTGSL